MDAMTRLIIYIVGGTIGILIAGRLFDCKMSPPKAFAASVAGGLAYLLPTVGSVAGLLVMVAAIRQLSDLADWQNALFTAFVANGVVLIVAVFLQVA